MEINKDSFHFFFLSYFRHLAEFLMHFNAICKISFWHDVRLHLTSCGGESHTLAINKSSPLIIAFTKDHKASTENNTLRMVVTICGIKNNIYTDNYEPLQELAIVAEREGGCQA